VGKVRDVTLGMFFKLLGVEATTVLPLKLILTTNL
jgi:hypothetical protein